MVTYLDFSEGPDGRSSASEPRDDRKAGKDVAGSELPVCTRKSASRRRTREAIDYQWRESVRVDRVEQIGGEVDHGGG